MIEKLSMPVRIAGMILILLAGLHVPIRRHLKWREESARLSPANAAIFQVHTFFICFVLVMMGLPCLLEPSVLLDKSRAGAWLTWSFAAFWTTRLFVQWFVFPKELWQGKRMETIAHVSFSILWIALSGLFTTCGFWQAGWLK
jgi:hypothetical protein